MYSRVINYIKQPIDITEVKLEEGLKYSVSKTYLKGAYVIRIGEPCRFIGFINKGLMVTTTVDSEGRESAFDFKCENCFFTYTEGHPTFETLFKKILAEDLANVLQNQQNLKEQSAEERYLALEHKYPDGLQRIMTT